MAKGISSLSITDLQREIQRRRKGVVKLLRKRAVLARRLASLDAKIDAAGGAQGAGGRASGGRGRASGRRVRRPRNKVNLVQALHKALTGKTMSVTDVAAAVKAAGYRTGSPNFRTMVNAALLKKKFFKRTGRGMYTAV